MTSFARLRSYGHLPESSRANPGLGYVFKDRVLEIDDFIATVKRVGGGVMVLDPEVVTQPIDKRDRHGALR